MKTSLAPSTRRKHLSALDRLYDSVQRQRGSDCLDRLIAEADADALEDCLVGFLAQLRNEAAVTNVDKTSTWTSAVSFVSDMLCFSGTSGARAAEIEAKVLRLETLYRQLVPNPETPPLPIRALPPLVIEDRVHPRAPRDWDCGLYRSARICPTVSREIQRAAIVDVQNRVLDPHRAGGKVRR
ncbi:hypothetical protein [Sinorhizobium fredii]|uniref:hypothetical protein n=1 Tax=Rhizobium fredii TaxID=380 RepID=UPI0004B51FFC|nr:hypothetical protein [Sinorhizobium fredii]